MRYTAITVLIFTLLTIAANSFPARPFEPTPLEESLIKQPFASENARQHLHRADLDLEPLRPMPRSLKRLQLPEPERNDMDFRLPDREYWRAIPPEARQVPSNWKPFPVVRFDNTEIGGRRDIRLHTTPNYDQWLLQDYAHHVTACISVQRKTRRIYFMQFSRTRNGSLRFKVADDNCYSCHPSGPRIIRPFVEPIVNLPTLRQFNERILSYHACDYGNTIDPAIRGEPLHLPACVGCHNGVNRGVLYQTHIPTVQFKMHDEQTMPPHHV